MTATLHRSLAPTLSREEWLAQRRKSIGGSDAPCIFGKGFKSAIELWGIKTGKIQDEDDLEDVDAVQVGNATEELNVNLAAKRERLIRLTDRREIEALIGSTGTAEVVGWLEDRQPFVRSIAHEWRTCTLDGIALDQAGEPVIFEAKFLAFGDASDWADGSMPQRTALQLAHDLSIIDVAKRGLGTAFIRGGRQQRAWLVSADVDLAELVRLEAEFWENVQTGVPPEYDGSVSAQKAIGRLHPDDNGETVAFPDELAKHLGAWAEAKQRVKDAEALVKDFGARAKLAIGDATYAVCSDGRTLSCKTIERNPRCPHCQEVTSRSKYRDLRLLKG